MNTLPNPLHNAWADSMADWGMTHAEVIQHRALEAQRMNALTADYTPADRHEGVGWIELQGCREQGWPARRCSPEMAVYDPTEDDKRQAMSPAECYLLAAIYCLSAVFVTWLVTALVKAWS